MNKIKTIENMANYFYEMYQLAINDESVPVELILELDFYGDSYTLNCDEKSWFGFLNYLDETNGKVVELAKQKPELYENCKILNRKLVLIIDGMKNVMQKDMNVTGWIRNNGRIEGVY